MIKPGFPAFFPGVFFDSPGYADPLRAKALSRVTHSSARQKPQRRRHWFFRFMFRSCSTLLGRRMVPCSWFWFSFKQQMYQCFAWNEDTSGGSHLWRWRKKQETCSGRWHFERLKNMSIFMTKCHSHRCFSLFKFKSFLGQEGFAKSSLSCQGLGDCWRGRRFLRDGSGQSAWRMKEQTI